MTLSFGICIITLTLLTHAQDDFDVTVLVSSDEVVNALFPRICIPNEQWRDESSQSVSVQCQFQKGRFFDMLSKYGDDMERLGCHVDRDIIRYLGDTFGSNSYVNNPLFQRMGDDCGFCGVKASCCGPKNAKDVANRLTKSHPDLKGMSPFYFQSIKGNRCSGNSGKVCTYNPLTPNEFQTLKTLQPFTRNVDQSNDCNFAQFGYSEWESARENPSYPVAEPLVNKFLCRAFSTNRPRLNCVKDPSSNQCKCCCHNNFPRKQGSGYVCVEDNSGPNEKLCSNN